MIKNKQILGLFLILLLLSLSCSGLDLKYINTDYSFYSACQNYDIISDKDIALERPAVATTTAKTGSLSNCQWKVIKETPKEVYTPIYTKTCKEDTAKNGTKSQNCSTNQTGTTTKTVTEISKTTDFTKQNVTKDKPTKVQYCCDIHRTYTEEKGYNIEVDIIPTLSGKEYTEYAWFNSSYFWRTPINCSLITNTTIPVVLNGSGGIYINGSKQIIWTQCVPTLAVYYNNYNDYLVANDTQDIPFEVELGDIAHKDTSVFPSSILYGVWLLDNSGYDSTNQNNLTQEGTGGIFTAASVGNGFACQGTAWLQSTTFTGLNGNYTITVDALVDSWTATTVEGILSDSGSDEGKAVERLYYAHTYLGATDKLISDHGDTGAGGKGAVINDQVTISTDVWYSNYVVLTGNNEILSINNQYNKTGSFTGKNTNTNPFNLCTFYDSSAIGDTVVDNVFIWKDSLSPAERTQIYSNHQNISGFGTVETTEEQPTTTTTTTSGSTTTTIPTPEGNHGVNYIYSIMFPVFAFLAMLWVFLPTEEDIPKIIKPLIASALWFISGYFTTSIRFIGDFTVSRNTYYIDAGNGDVSTIFTGLSVLFFVYAIFILLSILLESMEETKDERSN
jgi:hypothetical protein